MSELERQSSSQSLVVKSFPWIALPALLTLLVCVGAIPMTWQQQAFFGALMVAIALVIGRLQKGRAGTLVLVMFSMCSTARYALWRIGSLEHYFTSPWQAVNGWNSLFMLLLLGAEVYSFLILYLGYMQTIAPLRRPPVHLPLESDHWPTVDLMIPTYNEPLDVVRSTVLAAKNLDWPQHKLNIWLLDDGARHQFRDFAREAGVEYIARPEHQHAKAGNINYALERTTGELVAIFDCDHIPTRSFLQMTAGWFVHDPRLAMLQTPHHFYSPDPFERNLGHFRNVPNEGELFYGIIQDTNDFWNATFFCGSCALLRRTALDEVGGIAHETVTEDAHTSLRLQKRGWNTAYINLTQSGGLATETLGDHVKQRVRWARGMVQILRIDNPLLARGLSLSQRLCYLNATLHFMYALPRLIFLTAPIVYLVFGKLNIPGYWLTILVFAFPHLVLSMMTNSRVQGLKRHSFWNEIYETVLSPYILLPTLFALINPKFGKFNVTAKGQNQEEDSFDSKLARPFLVLLAMNLLALIMAVPRYLYWDQGHEGTIVMNVVWTLFNLVILGVTLSICWESKQRREAVRVASKILVSITGGMSNGVAATGVLENLSVSGAAVTIGGRWSVSETVQVAFPGGEADAVFSARVIGAAGGRLRLRFAIETLEQQEAITRVLFSGADRWLDWSDVRRRDNIFSSLFSVIAASLRGFRQSLQLLRRKPAAEKSSLPALTGKAAAILLLIGAIGLFLLSAHGQSPRLAQPQTVQHPEVSVDLPLSALGARNGVLLDNTNRNQRLVISLPSDVLMESGTLQLKYTLPQSKGTVSTLEVLLNDVTLAEITPTANDQALGHGEATVPLPADLMVRHNQLTLRLADAEGANCNVLPAPTAPIHIDGDSHFSLQEQRLVLASDLSLLPEPFVQRTATQGSQLPVVFAHQPSGRTLEAAGVLVSWLGSQTEDGQTSYPVSLGSLQSGNAVVVLLDGETLPGLEVPASDRATILTMANPKDSYGKLLVLSAATPNDLLQLTQALALGQLKLDGERASFGSLVLPPLRFPNDAPRWVRTRRVNLEALNGGAVLRTTDANPLNLYLRLSPEFNFGPDRDLYLHLDYDNDAAALDPRSNVVVRLNGSPADSIPLRAGFQRGRLQQANVALGQLPSSVFANTLQVQFYFVPTSAQKCDSRHFGGSIGSGSFLDIGPAKHLARLPNLHLFSNAGYPFTRMADLSETAVLLPEQASPGELTLYLDLLGYFGAQTGYPSLKLQVATPADAANGLYKNKDLLVMGTFKALSAMPWLNDSLPLQLRDESWELSRRARFFEKVRNWYLTLRRGGQAESDPGSDGGAPGGVIEQVRSPLGGNRSLVLVLARDDSSFAPMAGGLLAELPHDGIQGSVSLWQGGKFVSHAYNVSDYYLGEVNPLTRIKLILPDHPWALALGLTALFALLALWLDKWIIHRIGHRLRGVQFDLDGRPNVPASEPLSFEG